MLYSFYNPFPRIRGRIPEHIRNFTTLLFLKKAAKYVNKYEFFFIAFTKSKFANC